MTQIQISEKIFLEIEKRAKVSGFQKVNEFVEYVLQQLIEKSIQKQKDTTEEEKAITEQLRKSGYLE